MPVERPNAYLVEYTLLPEIFHRVIEANEALATGRAGTASEAARLAGLSRSAYYKYKDGVRPFFDAAVGRIVTFYLMLYDRPGALSAILSCMARDGADVVTVNQSIPMRGLASVTIAVRTAGLGCSVEQFFSHIEAASEVAKIEIVASE